MTGAIAMTAADLAGRLNLEKYPRSWRGTCPCCDYGRVFSVKAGKDHRPLVFCANGCAQDALADTLRRCFGEAWTHKAETKTVDSEAKRHKSGIDALKIWSGSVAGPNTLADRYLTRRALPGLAASAALRFRGDCYHPEQTGRYPAMVALVQDAAGAPLAIHRTYLAPDAKKSAIEPCKASKGPVWGGAIRLDAEAAEVVVGEGIESSASAGRLLSLPAWAAVSAGNLGAGLILPPVIRSVVIAADRDPVGEREAYRAAARWRAEGRRVRIAWPDSGADFNDILVQRQEGRANAAG